MAGITCFTSITNRKNAEWIIDTGATNHMTSHKTWLSNLRPNVTSFASVKLPNGQSSIVTHIGDYLLDSNHLLRDVLLVPGFQFNRISVSKSTRDTSCLVVFYHDRVEFQNLSNGRVKGIGKGQDGLYIWTNITTTPGAYVTVMEDDDLWHARLGHPSLGRMKILAANNGLSFHEHVIKNCAVYPLAK